MVFTHRSESKAYVKAVKMDYIVRIGIFFLHLFFLVTKDTKNMKPYIHATYEVCMRRSTTLRETCLPIISSVNGSAERERETLLLACFWHEVPPLAVSSQSNKIQTSNITQL